MASEVYEFNPVSSIAVGAVGDPGRRVFFLQATRGADAICVKLEKEQVFALHRGIEDILQQLEQREIRPVSSLEEPGIPDLGLQEPLEPAFVAGHMGLAFDQSSDMMVLLIQELAEDDGEEGSLARFWASPGQMRALSRQAREAVAAGRPICPLCHRPMDPDGHSCPRGNGHDHGTQVD